MNLIFIFPLATLQAAKSSTPSDNKKREIKILAFGDSLTAGYRLKEEEAYPAQLQKLLLARGFENLKIHNAGVSGDTTQQGLTRVEWNLKNGGPYDWVLLCLGANDGLRQLPLNEMEKNLNQLITIFKKHGAKVMLIGVQLPTNYNSKYRTDFEAIFPKLAKKNQIHFHPFLLGSIFGNKDLFLTDMIHPNADGQKKVASKLLEKLEKLL